MPKDPAIQRADILVIGAGIAGASVAAELSAAVSVVLLEMEPVPGYHTTGRSAAVFAPTYGPAPIRALTRASEAFYRDPPQGFTADALLSPRDTLMIARSDQMTVFEAAHAEISGEASIVRLSGDDLRSRQPLLKPGYAAAGFLDPTGSDIDVNALHQGYLRAFRAAGCRLVANARVTAMTQANDGWEVETTVGRFAATRIVNAAGAWADEIGALAGVENIGLVPKRRTAVLVGAPQGITVGDLPLTADIEENFYLKPDSGRLLLSPADETPIPPCDVQPEELDIAICIDRIETAFELNVRKIENKWAGLRSFVADKSPVVGYSDQADGFFWLAGQGGYGIQTAPALSRFAAALVLGRPVPRDILAKGLNPRDLSPSRLSDTLQDTNL